MATAAGVVVIEDWSVTAVGTTGIPLAGTSRTGEARSTTSRWWSTPPQECERHSNVNRDIRGKVHLAGTPILEWTWKVVALPDGADARNGATDDQAAQLYARARRRAP
jgi:hypothetical protein